MTVISGEYLIRIAGRPRAIGIFGGTFAPIHNGHLQLALTARDRLGLAQVRLLPSALPPLRGRPVISAERRLEWVKLAIQGHPRLIADGRELERDGPSYTFDTLASFRAEFPRTPLCLLLGQDAVQQLPQWHRWESLIEYAHLVFFNRPGVPEHLPVALARVLQERAAHDATELHRAPAGLWWHCEMPPMDLSATVVRAALRDGQPARAKGMIPPAVLKSLTQSDMEAFAYDEDQALAAH